MILDEATNAIDLWLERRILAALAKQRGQMTILAVTHRLSNLDVADRVLALQGGHVVERQAALKG